MGVMEEVIKVYRGICRECLRKPKPMTPENMQQLKFIFFENISSQTQTDPIDYCQRAWTINGVPTIFRLSQWFCPCYCLPNKEPKTVGKSLVKILATAVMPKILQTDNGGECTGKGIRKIEKHYTQ